MFPCIFFALSREGESGGKEAEKRLQTSGHPWLGPHCPNLTYLRKAKREEQIGSAAHGRTFDAKPRGSAKRRPRFSSEGRPVNARVQSVLFGAALSAAVYPGPHHPD